MFTSSPSDSPPTPSWNQTVMVGTSSASIDPSSTTRSRGFSGGSVGPFNPQTQDLYNTTSASIGTTTMSQPAATTGSLSMRSAPPIGSSIPNPNEEPVRVNSKYGGSSSDADDSKHKYEFRKQRKNPVRTMLGFCCGSSRRMIATMIVFLVVMVLAYVVVLQRKLSVSSPAAVTQRDGVASNLDQSGSVVKEHQVKRQEVIPKKKNQQEKKKKDRDLYSDDDLDEDEKEIKRIERQALRPKRKQAKKANKLPILASKKKEEEAKNKEKVIKRAVENPLDLETPKTKNEANADRIVEKYLKMLDVEDKAEAKKKIQSLEEKKMMQEQKKRLKEEKERKSVEDLKKHPLLQLEPESFTPKPEEPEKEEEKPKEEKSVVNQEKKEDKPVEQKKEEEITVEKVESSTGNNDLLKKDKKPGKKVSKADKKEKKPVKKVVKKPAKKLIKKKPIKKAKPVKKAIIKKAKKPIKNKKPVKKVVKKEKKPPIKKGIIKKPIKKVVKKEKKPTKAPFDLSQHPLFKEEPHPFETKGTANTPDNEAVKKEKKPTTEQVKTETASSTEGKKADNLADHPLFKEEPQTMSATPTEEKKPSIKKEKKPPIKKAIIKKAKPTKKIAKKDARKNKK